MAQKRMLNKSISLSAQVNKLNLKEKIIFTWSIPHLDDYGLLNSDPEVIKATTCPMIKDITLKDIRGFIVKASELELLKEYRDCLEFTGFTNHQSISEEKKAKMKFSKIPRNPQENIGENNNPQKSPVQDKIREDKISKDKIREERTPSQVAISFFQSPEDTIFLLKERGLNEELVRREISKFVAYWTEPNNSGTKQRWELQPVFDVGRRLSTWFGKIKEFSDKSNKYQVKI